VSLEKHIRPDWDTYYIDQLENIGRRGTCDRGRSGAIIVAADHHPLISGYVGSPPGLPHCDDVGHEFEWRLTRDPRSFSSLEDLLEHVSKHCVRTIHSESNIIFFAAKVGIALEGSTLYCTMTPCRKCAEAIVQAGVKRVVTKYRYHAAEATINYFTNAGVELVTLGDYPEYVVAREHR
jgi:dCMP deaminase